jgi:D-alanyl-D-alanine carboxypeptidase
MHLFRSAAAAAGLLVGGACVPQAPASSASSASPEFSASRPTTGTEPMEVLGDLQSAIDSIAIATVEGGELPGIAVGVWAGGKPVHLRGYGLAVLEGAVAATDSTAFRIGSIAKQITAAAVLRMEEQGRLSVSDPISRYLANAPAHWEAVTIHHLLNHTSGIPSYTELEEWRRRSSERLTIDQLIALFRELPLEFEPGAGWVYNNSGYLLLGPVIERVSGLPYAEYVVEELAAPLGLRETGECGEQAPGIAVGYRPGPDGFVPAAGNQLGGTFADGDLCSSARDLLRWTAALAEGRVVSPGTYTRMTTPGMLSDGREFPYGYGFQLLHHEGAGRVVEHGGGVPGFVSSIAYYPEQEVIIAVLTNRGTNTAPVVKEAIARHLFADLRPPVLDIELPTERISTYTASYDLYLSPSNIGPFPATIVERDGKIMAQVEEMEIPLLWQGRHEFVDGLDLGLRLSFEVEDARAVKLVMQRSGMTFEGERRQ